MLRFRVLGASFSRFRGLRFRSRVLRFRDLGASCFGLRFRVLRFRNYHAGSRWAQLVSFVWRMFRIITDSDLRVVCTLAIKRNTE